MPVPAEHAWAGYARTMVEIIDPGGASVVVGPARPGLVGAWPWPSPEPVFILTAWDPGNERPGETVNRERQRAIEAELRPLATRAWRTVGFDPVTGYRDEGVAVSGVAETEVRRAATRYGQDAAFCWSPGAWAVVSCRGDRRLVSGWTVTSGPLPSAPTVAR